MSVLLLLDRGLPGEHRGAHPHVGLLPHSRRHPVSDIRVSSVFPSGLVLAPCGRIEARAVSQPRHGRSIMSRSFSAIGSLVVLLAVAPSASGAGGPLVDPIGRTLRQGRVTIALQPVASGLVAPNWGATAPGDPTRLFVS